MIAMDPLAGSAWSTPGTVAGFVRSPPNEALLSAAAKALDLGTQRRLLDIGCGAGRNLVPLALMGWNVLGTDLSWPMLVAAGHRVAGEGGRPQLVLAPMDALPVATQSIDFVVAHGIWNLAPSSATFRRAVAEAGRVARPGAALFVFTFSRHTLPPDAQPVPGERFVLTQFSGQPQCFLTEDELLEELSAAGFDREPDVPIREHNRPRAGALIRETGPVIYEGLFRRRH
jgi:SAM-dependent methyltransferase